jgi:hypothetical protein
MAHTSMILFALFSIEVAVRTGIEHCLRVLPANDGAKVRQKNKTAKDFRGFIVIIIIFSLILLPFQKKFVILHGGLPCT